MQQTIDRESSSEASSATVDICICTFRRISLGDTLRSLQSQRGFPGSFKVIVADNDDSPTAAKLVEDFVREGMEILYVHAPSRNISIARNACLDQATATWIAFIDDDEVADPNWLGNLFSVVFGSSFTAAFGPVRAIYEPDAPTWGKQADLHSTRPVETSRGIETGYTSNAIMLRSAAITQRFDVALGRSGGEDTDFFTRLHLAGHRFASAPEAVVTERVTPARMSMTWLGKRAFRAGQTHARRFLSSPPHRARETIVATGKVLACLGLALVRGRSAAGWRRAVVRGALHLGVAARLLGVREPKLYG